MKMHDYTAEELWREFQKKTGTDAPYEAWAFGADPDGLAGLVLAGVKRATASAAALYEIEGETPPKAGDYSVVLDSHDRALCVIQTTRTYIKRFCDVDENQAWLEGEGDRTLDYWRRVHEPFFREEYAGDGLTFTPDQPVLCEEFEVVYRPTCPIRPMRESDKGRIAEILVYSNRKNYLPIFGDEEYSFVEMTVDRLKANFEACVGKEEETFVLDDGILRGFLTVGEKEIKKLYVDPFFTGRGYGARLLEFAIREKEAEYLWALEKNTGALRFYRRYQFRPTGERKPEEGSDEWLCKLKRV